MSHDLNVFVIMVENDLFIAGKCYSTKIFCRADFYESKERAEQQLEDIVYLRSVSHSSCSNLRVVKLQCAVALIELHDLKKPKRIITV